MKVTLEEVVAGVRIDEEPILFTIQSNGSSRLIAIPELPEALPKHLSAHYSKIQLDAQDFLSANDELRTRLARIGLLLPTYFWHKLTTPRGIAAMCIKDNDPTHRDIRIDGDWWGGNTQKPVFSKLLDNSKLTAKYPHWDNRELCVRLKPLAAQQAQRLSTYSALLKVIFS